MNDAPNAIRTAIRDASQAVFALYRAEGLGACQGHDWRTQGQETEAALDIDHRHGATYLLAYTTAAEYVVAGLPGLH